MLARIFTAILFVAVMFLPTAGAENAEAGMTLPAMGRCTDNSHPLLPKMWHGTYLMAPFTKAQLVLGDFTYDGTVTAMRIRLYGVRGGAADLLVKRQKTYLLSPGEGPSGQCLDLGDTGLRPLPQDLLAANALCEGSAPVHGTMVSWWKSPSTSKPSANWIWYKASDRSPFRLMFTQPASEFGVLGLYTFSYQVSFETLSNSPLGNVAAACESKSRRAEVNGRAALQKIIADMEHAPSRNDGELASLMPDLAPVCPAMPLPGWPQQTSMTAFMTTPDFNSKPEPTEVLYDWSRQSQRTRMFLPKSSGLAAEDALLAGKTGFSVTRSSKGPLTCTSGLPGPPRPNWPETGGCSCEAAIKGTTPLNPNGPARIMVCPMTAPRVVWSWFEFSGRPLVFMETSAPGDDPSTVLAIVDYYDWKPNYVPSDANFEIPAKCFAAERNAGHQGASQHGTEPGQRQCGACHLDSIPGP